MNIKDVIYEVKSGREIDHLVPVTLIKTQEDIDLYKSLGCNTIFTKQEFEHKYPSLDVNKFFYSVDLFSKLIYLDMDKLIYKELFFIGKDLLKFNPTETDENEIIKIINIFENVFEKKEWSTLLTSAEGAIRFYLLNYGIENNIINPDELYELFIDIYTGTDYGADKLSKESFKKIVGSKTKEQVKYTQDILSAFGNTITVYRGEGNRNINNAGALSWTTNINVANFFATRLASDRARIIKARVKKSDVIEYIDSRNEREILIEYEKVKIIDTIEMYGFKENDNKYLDHGSMNEFYQYKYMLKEMIPFKNDLEGHGKIHCLRVLLNAIIIANHEGINKVFDRTILFTACIAHDMARDHDYDDAAHGKEAYDLLIKECGMAENKDLEFIMKYHSIPDRLALKELKNFPKDRQEPLKKLLYILKDADALDRVRFGIRSLDMDFLRLDFSKTLTLTAIQILKGIKL